ncbi:MAG TPA: hypothetical protein VE010_17970, partial [Thermoanaerobaculia bacterium]|nr:hypothetical protein [Thermoanaerobaculia bacterium]
MMRRVKRIIAVLAVTVASCTAPAPAPVQETQNESPRTETAAPSTATTAPPVELSQRCTNAQHGFTISYPDGWHTNDGSVIPACSAFDPQPVDIPRNSEIPFGIAAMVNVQQTSVQDLTRTSQWERVLSSSETTVDGKKATRVEIEATGEGLAERGMRTVRYVVDLGGGRALVASTNATGESYKSNQEMLARMVESIDLP